MAPPISKQRIRTGGHVIGVCRHLVQGSRRCRSGLYPDEFFEPESYFGAKLLYHTKNDRRLKPAKHAAPRPAGLAEVLTSGPFGVRLRRLTRRWERIMQYRRISADCH